MNEPVYPDIHQTPPAVCRLLRGKTGYGTLEGGENPWLLLDASTAIYWCLHTSASCGPDDGLAHPDLCRVGRACFSPPREAAKVATPSNTQQKKIRWARGGVVAFTGIRVQPMGDRKHRY